MLKFLQLFPDMLEDHFEPLTDEELGIIVRAAMQYAFAGEEPAFERRSVLDLTWRRMRRHIDNCEMELTKMAELGSRGGKNSAAKREQAKPTEGQAKASGGQAKSSEAQAEASERQAEASETQAKPTEGQAEPSESNHNQNQNQNQDQYQDHNQNHNHNQDHKSTGERAHARFTPPTVEEVQAYCRERKNSVDAQKFVDHYSANGWLVGRNKMRDWRAAVRTWERSSFDVGRAEKPPDYQRRSYSDADFRAMEVDLDQENTGI